MPKKAAKPAAPKRTRKRAEKRKQEPKGPRVGVFVCQCGSNVASVINVDELAKYAQALPDVVYVEQMNYPCSNQGQDEIVAAIKKNKLERVVVAGCSPRLYEPTFQRCVSKADLNPWLFEMANIREFSSYCHKAEPAVATEKAKDIVRMAVAKARVLNRLSPLSCQSRRKLWSSAAESQASTLPWIWLTWVSGSTWLRRPKP